MDSGSDSDGPSNPSAGPSSYDFSQQSTGRSDHLQPGQSVKLVVPRFGEVGVGSVIELRPSGQWLGVTIPPLSVEFILVRPSSIVLSAENLFLEPRQRGCTVLRDVLNRTVLWGAGDVLPISGDPPMDGTEHVRPESWIGLEVHRLDNFGVVLSSGRVNCSNPEEHFRDGRLGEGYIGVTILDVFVGDIDAIMSNDRWFISECKFPNGRSLQSTVDYFSRIPATVDPEEHLGGRQKIPYRFILRKPKSHERLSQYKRKTVDGEVRKVSSESCCSKHCCQTFPRAHTLTVRQRFYLKSFEERREYGIAVGGQMHFIDGDRKRKYLTLHGSEVCTTAWYLIHGIPKSTFHSYVERYNEGILSAAHGNKGYKRPRIGTVQVMGTIAAIVKENADQMPHQMRGIGNGRMDTLKFLPAGNNWKRVMADANETNVSYGLPTVSQSTISRIRKELFNNIAIKPVGSSFAKCTTCDQLQEFLLKSPKGSPEYVEFVKQREQHLAHQQSCRRLYGAWREESKRNPTEILCIIHDKMDSAKTALPRMRVTTKATQGLGQLPMNVTGMVAHGHGDGAYAHYSPQCWPGDSNATISSLAKLFRRLEGPSIRESGVLFENPPQNSLFEALLRGKSRCVDILPSREGMDFRGAQPLPTNLYLQLDNSAKDNKNQYLMAFLSLMTARGVFKEIQVGFLLVGHTHEDIDAYFSHLSKALKSKNTFVLADLMKAFMQSQDLSFMPEFIQEVADFKSFIRGYQSSGATRLIGLGEMHLFKFYVDTDGWPVMRYKKSAVDAHWLPLDRPPLRLWIANEDGSPKLPHGSPKPVPFKPMWGSEVPKSTGNQVKAKEMASKATENKKFMKLGLQKYIDYWRSGMAKCEGFAAAFGPYVDYWTRVLSELDKPLPVIPPQLVEGFWPRHDWRVVENEMLRPRCLPLLHVDVTPEDEEPEPYCGPANEAPEIPFNPWRDIRPGSWVLLRPEDPLICPVWQGRATSVVCRKEGDVNIGKFLIQFWEPKSAERDLALKYRNCWYAKWVVENRAPEWVSIDAVVFATWSKIMDPRSRTIPKKSMECALANLNRANLVDP